MNGKNQFGKQRLPRRALLAMALAAINFGALAQHLEEDHREFEATLYAPYTAGAKAAAASPWISPTPSLKAPMTSSGASNCSMPAAIPCSAGKAWSA